MKTEPVSFRVPIALKRRWKAAALREHRTLTSFVTIAATERAEASEEPPVEKGRGAK